MAVTMKQIAQIAGVSRGTVDRALHNRPGVNAETSEHIKKIAKDLGFEPNIAGRALAAKKQPLNIGCFVPSVGNAFFDDVINGFRKAEAELSGFGVSVTLEVCKGYNPKTHIKSIKKLVDSDCNALCISTIDTKEISGYLSGLIEDGIPVIAVNTDFSGTDRICYVGCDYLKCGKTAAGLLTMMMSEKIELLMVTGSNKIKGHNDRVKGFSSTLREKKGEYKLVEVFECLDSDEYAYKQTFKALEKHSSINSIYVVGAGVKGVCEAVLKLGREKDIYILTHDEIDTTCEMVERGVINATISQEPVVQGYHSIRTMYDYFMSGKKIKPSDRITETIIRIKENLRV